MARKADTFAVWGAPPKTLTKGLTAKQIIAMKRYVDDVTGRTYRIAFDNGVNHGLAIVTTAALKEQKRQRDAMARS